MNGAAALKPGAKRIPGGERSQGRKRPVPRPVVDVDDLHGAILRQPVQNSGQLGMKERQDLLFVESRANNAEFERTV